VPSGKYWDSRPILMRPQPLPQTINALLCNYHTIWYHTVIPIENVIKEI